MLHASRRLVCSFWGEVEDPISVFIRTHKYACCIAVISVLPTLTVSRVVVHGSLSSHRYLRETVHQNDSGTNGNSNQGKGLAMTPGNPGKIDFGSCSVGKDTYSRYERIIL